MPNQDHYSLLAGTIRAHPPNITIARLKPLLDNLGITRVANVTGLDTIGLPVAVSIRPTAKHLSVSQGKGLTWELAYLSAIMESCEGYHAENPAAPHLEGSYQKLKKYFPVINPILFADTIFNPNSLTKLNLVWTEAHDLINKKKVYLPYYLINFDLSAAHPEGVYFNPSSNGLAAGNTLEEAICHSIYELIERDSLFKFAKLHSKQKNLRQINLETIESSINQQLLMKYHQANIRVKVWEISTRLDVPAFYSEIYDDNFFRNLPTFRGSGAHLNKEVALSRALTESAQSRLTYITGSREDISSNFYQRTAIHRDGYHAGIKNFQSCLQPVVNYNFNDQITYLLNTLIKHQYQHVYLVNHTKAKFQIPVVHLFIPHLKFKMTHL